MSVVSTCVRGLLVLTLASGCASSIDRGASAAAPASSKVADSNLAQRAKIATELGGLYLQEGRFSVALEEARKALAVEPNYAPAYNLLGLIHMFMGEAKVAELHFKQALALAPGDPEIANNYGWYLCQTGQERASLDYFLSSARNPLYGTPAKPYTNAGICLLRLKETGAAEEYLHTANRLMPNNPQTLFWLAEANFRQGKYLQARRWTGELERLTELGIEALWLAVRTERKLGSRENENRYIVQMRKRFPDAAETQRVLRGEYE